MTLRKALRLAEIGNWSHGICRGMSVHDQIAAMDIHSGNPDDAIGHALAQNGSSSVSQ